MTQDTTVKKVSSGHSPTGPQGQVYLASGKRVSMRLWRDEEPIQDEPSHSGRVEGENAAGGEPVKHHPDGGEVLFDGRGGLAMAEVLDVSRDVIRREGYGAGLAGPTSVS